MDLVTELSKLEELRKSGALSEAEFTIAKQKLLAANSPSAAATPVPTEAKVTSGVFDPKKNLVALWRAALLLCLGAVMVWVWLRLMNPTGKAVPIHRTVVGRTLVPWVDRAEAFTRQAFDGESGQNAASTILSRTHPTGSKPKLASVDVRKIGDKLSVRIQTDWEGGLTGSKYSTVVVWEFDKTQHYKATVTSDSAPVGINASNAKGLDDYFRTEVYSVIRSNMHD